MKELTIISGKGGTGKTSVAAALAASADKAVCCDNDVDAADLHLILAPEIQEAHAFPGGNKAMIDLEQCTACGTCMQYCRFDAIHLAEADFYQVDPFRCEGCRLCEKVCPSNAIRFHQRNGNNWFVSNTRFGVLVHARMSPGEENSGKLVTRIRKKAREIANDTGTPYLLNDGPPGIGCSAIASLTGTDMALMVLEPGKTGIHDAGRLLKLIRSLEIPVAAVINKFDLDHGMSEDMEDFLHQNQVPLLSRLPFDRIFVQAMIAGKTVQEFDALSQAAVRLGQLWNNIRKNYLS